MARDGHRATGATVIAAQALAAAAPKRQLLVVLVVQLHPFEAKSISFCAGCPALSQITKNLSVMTFLRANSTVAHLMGNGFTRPGLGLPSTTSLEMFCGNRGAAMVVQSPSYPHQKHGAISVLFTPKAGVNKHFLKRIVYLGDGRGLNS